MAVRVLTRSNTMDWEAADAPAAREMDVRDSDMVRARPKRSLPTAAVGPLDEDHDGSSTRVSSPGISPKRRAPDQDSASTTTGEESPDSLGESLGSTEADELQAGSEVAGGALEPQAALCVEVLAEAAAEADAILKFQLPRAELVAVLAKLLAHLANLGTCRPHHLTAFHSVTKPPVSIHDYLERLAKHFRCSDECLVLALVYIDRVVKNRPDFVFTTRNAHRLLATSLTVAAKFNDDMHYSNRYYAQCAGVKLQDLNVLEAQFICLVGWRFKVLPEEYCQYLRHIVNARPAPLLANSLT